MQDRAAQRPVGRLTVVSLTALPALLALLYFVRLPSLSIITLAAMIVLLSWCLYQYFLPFHHLRRRALLAHVTAENSVLRRWLWNGFWSRLLLVMVSVVLAMTVLMVVNGLSDREWLWLLLCVPVLLLLLPLSLRLTGTESDGRYHFPMALRVAVWLSVAVATLGLMLVHLGGEGVPDTRHLDVITLMSQTWVSAASQSTVPVVSSLIAIEAVSDALVWHLMQQAASLSAQPALFKFGVWLIFLLFLTLRVAIVWFALAGLLYWLAGPGNASDGRADPPLRAFGLGMLLLGLGSWLLSLPGISAYMTALTERLLRTPSPVMTADPVDPCVAQAPQELLAIRQQTQQNLVSEQQRLQHDFLQAGNAALDEVFALAEPAVEQYLDWNYSVAGQYQQLGVLTAAAFRNMVNRVQQSFADDTPPVVSIEQAFAGFLSAQIDQRLQPVLTPALLARGQQLEALASENARQFMTQHMAYTEQLAASAMCLRFEMPALSEIELTRKSLVGLGPVSGMLAAQLAARSSIHAGSALIGQQATRRMISASSARVASRTAQSASVGSAGGLCGPASLVCVPALFAASWLATDVALNELDEALNREQLKQELMAALALEKQRLQQHYADAFVLFINQLVQQLDGYHEQRFRIIEQGIAPGDGNLPRIPAE